MIFRSHRVDRPFVAFLHDIVMAAVSFVIALYLRIGDDMLAQTSGFIVEGTLLFTVVCAVVFWRMKLYRGMWRYASVTDLIALTKAVSLALLIFLPLLFLLTRLELFPRSVPVINWFVLIFLLGAPRMFYRVFKDRGFDHVLERKTTRRVPVLLVGTGDSAEVFIREMARDRHAPYDVLGLVDEKGTRVGRRIHGVPVLGHLDDLNQIVESLKAAGKSPQRLILTKRPEREDLDLILMVAEAKGMTIARLPRLTELRSGDEQKIELRPVAIEDLLGRTRTPLDRAAMRRLIADRRVLVTGAGGTIGSELVRQVAEFRPAHLSLLDNTEHQLYAIGLELDEAHGSASRAMILGDVRDPLRLEQVMVAEQPELVFHAAALKHVPMVEANPVEGVLTNVIGTRNAAEACRKAGAAAMVLISTDKAVNPTSVMGATKRLAECYCQALDLAAQDQGGKGTRFITVRFGNVLGSAGSVVPLFHHQLAGGRPLTVTHPEITRYFMDLREAVELVLQASALGLQSSHEEAGKIYVLEMGEPIRIMELARQMIRLAGLRPDKDVKIDIIGLRPGEKLHEELFHESEPLVGTGHPGLRLAAPRTTNLELLRRSLDELADLCSAGGPLEAMRLLKHLVPEYQSEADKDRASR